MIKKTLMSCLLLSAFLPNAFPAEGRAVRTRRPTARRPAEVKAPEGLLPGTVSVTVAVPKGLTQDREILAAADNAARWTAEQLSRTRGQVEGYRVGWYQGMNTALNDASLGDWDRAQGFEAGLRDLEAGRQGRRIGREQAQERAVVVAGQDVEKQFMDLRRAPRFDPRLLDAGRPDWRFGEAVAVRPPQADLFRRTPVGQVPYFRDQARLSRYDQAFGNWKLDPLDLCDVKRYQDIYEDDWADPDAAFRFWSRNSVRRVVARRRRAAVDRDLFRQRFEIRFQEVLPAIAGRYIQAGFENGFNDGWEYGAWIRYEQGYEEGFADGYDQAVSLAASRSFARNWNGFYARSYEAAFDRWMDTVRVEVLDVRLEDGDQDGVFEPGETVLVFWELANYGGGAGRMDLGVGGNALSRSVAETVEIRGRGVLQAVRPIRVRIDPETPVRNRSKVVVTVGEGKGSAGLVVARPLQFGNGWAIDGWAILDGIAGIDLQVTNLSRRPVTGMVRMEREDGEGALRSRDLGRMAAGEERMVRFRLTGLEPLDLVSGDLQVRFQVIGDEEGEGGLVHDRVDVKFPNVAIDLSRDDLLVLMLRMAEDPGVTDREIRRVRELVMERMRADWRVAAQGRRNPYKRDYKERTGGTALGELVRMMNRRPSRVPSPRVFQGLGDDLADLSLDLPGAHPFLRKWFLKLARRVG